MRRSECTIATPIVLKQYSQYNLQHNKPAINIAIMRHYRRYCLRVKIALTFNRWRKLFDTEYIKLPLFRRKVFFNRPPASRYKTSCLLILLFMNNLRTFTDSGSSVFYSRKYTRIGRKVSHNETINFLSNIYLRISLIRR